MFVSAAEERKEGRGPYKPFRDPIWFCLCEVLVSVSVFLNVRQASSVRFFVKVQPKLQHQGCFQQPSAAWVSTGGQVSQPSPLQTSLHWCSHQKQLFTVGFILFCYTLPTTWRGEGIKPYTCHAFIPFIIWKDQGRLEDKEQWSLLRSSGKNKHGRISCRALEQRNTANWGGDYSFTALFISSWRGPQPNSHFFGPEHRKDLWIISCAAIKCFF